MTRFKHALIMVILLLTALSVYAQTRMEELNPETIDIYSYDPTEQGLGKTADYRERAYGFYQEGKFDKAAQYYLAYLKANPEDANSWYNLSCCYGLLGGAKEAAKYVKIAYKKGFKDLNHIRNDKDFELVRTAKTFTAAMDSLQIWNDKEALYKGKMEYFAIGQYVPYWIHLPKDYDKTKKNTLLIGLHGYGDVATNFSRLWKYLADENVIFVVPEAPYAIPENNDAGFSWSPFVDLQSKTAETSYSMLEKYILALTRQLEKKYSVKQTWIMGFSQGAYMSYMLALKNPRVYDGLLACGGGLVTEVFKDKDYRKAKKVKVIISHGKKDKVIDYAEAEKAYSTLKAKGLDVTLDSFEGGHFVSPTAFDLFLKNIK